MISLKEFFFLVFGFFSTVAIFSFLYLGGFDSKNELRPRVYQAVEKIGQYLPIHLPTVSTNKYDVSLAEQTFNEIRIVCLVMTHPENHHKKAIHVKNTWGRRCNKLLFFSNALDDVLDIVVLNMTESREALWHKTKESFKSAYENHFSDGDWFLKADDDTYIVMENLRGMLAQYNPEDSLYFGHRFTKLNFPDGYMSGGGYVLSKKAVEVLVNELLPKNCGGLNPGESDTGSEDFSMGICLFKHAVFVDCRDDNLQKRFFPVGMETHTWPHPDIEGYWYFQDIYYNTTQGSLNCCSDKVIQFHYITSPEMYAYEYFIYRVQPFGIDLGFDYLPRKLSMDEIIQRSNYDAPRRHNKEKGINR